MTTAVPFARATRHSTEVSTFLPAVLFLKVARMQAVTSGHVAMLWAKAT